MMIDGLFTILSMIIITFILMKKLTMNLNNSIYYLARLRVE